MKEYLVIRLYGYTFDFMKSNRKPRAYKIDDESYFEALKNAPIITGKPLANVIEDVVIGIAKGKKPSLRKPKSK